MHEHSFQQQPFIKAPSGHRRLRRESQILLRSGITSTDAPRRLFSAEQRGNHRREGRSRPLRPLLRAAALLTATHLSKRTRRRGAVSFLVSLSCRQRPVLPAERHRGGFAGGSPPPVCRCLGSNQVPNRSAWFGGPGALVPTRSIKPDPSKALGFVTQPLGAPLSSGGEIIPSITQRCRV